VRGNGAWVDVSTKCPYCEYGTTLTARDIRGQRFVLECLDCRETYVVEVACQVTHRTRALADVDKDEVLDRLAHKKNGGKAPAPPSRPAVGARAATAAAGDNRSRTVAADRPALKTRRMQGHRYGPGARGES
jgi:hypothetical protein